MTCHKKGYPSRLDAMIALALTQRVNAEPRGEGAKVYHCSPCRAWHLTSVR